MVLIKINISITATKTLSIKDSTLCRLNHQVDLLMKVPDLPQWLFIYQITCKDLFLTMSIATITISHPRLIRQITTFAQPLITLWWCIIKFQLAHPISIISTLLNLIITMSPWLWLIIEQHNPSFTERVIVEALEIIIQINLEGFLIARVGLFKGMKVDSAVRMISLLTIVTIILPLSGFPKRISILVLRQL